MRLARVPIRRIQEKSSSADAEDIRNNPQWRNIRAVREGRAPLSQPAGGPVCQLATAMRGAVKDSRRSPARSPWA